MNTKNTKNIKKLGPFVSKRDAVRVHLSQEVHPILEEDAWVDLRPGITVKTSTEPTDDPVTHYLARSIVDWSWDEDVTPENVADLDIGISFTLWEEVQKSLPKALQVQLPQTTDSPPTG